MIKKLIFISLAMCLNWADANTKIIGGNIAPEGAWPATVALVDKATIEHIEAGLAIYADGTTVPASEANYQAQFCGASLIHANWVLTAAHCVSDNNTVKTADSFYALVGTSDLTAGGTRMAIKRVIPHPNYNAANADRDIALLELNQATSQSAIPLHAGDPAVGAEATIVGWGATKFDFNTGSTGFPPKLLQTTVPITDRSTCRASLIAIDWPDAENALTNNMFCAGDGRGAQDSCQGDSGGPLFVQQNGEYHQAGITSWGPGCALPNTYGVYTRLSQFDDWIKSYTQPQTATENNNNQDSGGGGSVFWLLPSLGLVALLRHRKKHYNTSKYQELA